MTHWFAPTWLEYMTLASVALACVLNAAVLRDDLIHEDEESATGRRLIVAGMALIALRIGWLIADQVAPGLSVFMCLGLLLCSAGASLIAAQRIKKRWEPSRWNDDDTDPPTRPLTLDEMRRVYGAGKD